MNYTTRRIPPSALIDVDDERELAKWGEWLGVSESDILRAIEAVGPFASAVRDYLTQEE